MDKYKRSTDLLKTRPVFKNRDDVGNFEIFLQLDQASLYKFMTVFAAPPCGEKRTTVIEPLLVKIFNS